MMNILYCEMSTERGHSQPQVVGSVLSVVGVVFLTVLLIAPATHALVLPSWLPLSVTVTVASGAAVLTIAAGTKRHPLLACVSRATTAAVLFGLNSILIRTIGHILAGNTMVADGKVSITALLGLAVALPVGLWAMQTAYVSGAPHVVICCLTLLDPFTAVLGGTFLLHDGMVMTPFEIIAGIASALVAATGVIFLSVEYPAETRELDLETTPERPGGESSLTLSRR